MSRSARRWIGRIIRDDWTIRAGTGLNKPVGEVICNVTEDTR
jgi:hypothetical protein